MEVEVGGVEEDQRKRRCLAFLGLLCFHRAETS
jgi:hypothetical protein